MVNDKILVAIRTAVDFNAITHIVEHALDNGHTADRITSEILSVIPNAPRAFIHNQVTQAIKNKLKKQVETQDKLLRRELINAYF